MQSFLDQIRDLTLWHPAYLVGAAILAAALLQMVFLLIGSLLRLSGERKQQRLAAQQMELSIKAAVLRCQEAEQARLVWNGFRKFRLAKKVRECQDVHSFYLAPHDGKPI